MNKCEWNPEKNCPAMTHEVEGDCQNMAVLAIKHGFLHLCASCADLPNHKKYKRKYFKNPEKVDG